LLAISGMLTPSNKLITALSTGTFLPLYIAIHFFYIKSEMLHCRNLKCSRYLNRKCICFRTRRIKRTCMFMFGRKAIFGDISVARSRSSHPQQSRHFFTPPYDTTHNEVAKDSSTDPWEIVQ
jgi:hypothetical protein